MGTPISRIIFYDIRRVEARNAQAKPRLPHRECRIHPENRPDTSGDNAKNQQSPRTGLQISKEQMISNGWCPHQVHHLSKAYDFETFSYLATLKRSSRRLDDHKLCSRYSACIAYNTSTVTYKVQHTTDDCTCSMIATPYHDLVNVIRRGRIPLVSIELVTGASPSHELRVHSRSAASKYIAISHVWADGLGNPGQNGLPLCQIEKLHARLLALQRLFKGNKRRVLFWMDTLCIPVKQAEYPLRLIQIDKMASIYKYALTSLVLDAELMAIVPYTQLPPTESCGNNANSRSKHPRRLSVEARARIACSVWMCRSWTLQEGELPATIAVQFIDSAVVLGRAHKTNGDYLERFTDEPVSPDARIEGESEADHSADPELQGLDLPNTSAWNRDPRASDCECVDIDLQRRLFETFSEGSNELATVWNELSGRSTTMPNDVPIIITNLLDLDNRGLLTYYDSAEMFQAILISLKRLPMSLFLNTGPRRNGKHQNRWVPVKVGTDTLRSENCWKVRPSHLLYQHSPKDGDSHFSIFIVNEFLSLDTTVCLHSTTEDTIYTVEPSGSSADQLDRGEFTSTCIIIERATSLDCPGLQKGACFYVQTKQQAASRTGVLWSHSVKTSVLDLTFNCPIRLKKSSSRGLSRADREQAYLLNRIKGRYDLRIHYDPIPKFKRIRPRRNSFFAKFGTRVVIPFVIILCAALGFGCFIIFFRAAEGVDPGFFIFFAFGGILLAVVTIVVIQTVERWRYRRSFAAIAAKRPPEGAA